MKTRIVVLALVLGTACGGECQACPCDRKIDEDLPTSEEHPNGRRGESLDAPTDLTGEAPDSIAAGELATLHGTTRRMVIDDRFNVDSGWLQKNDGLVEEVHSVWKPRLDGDGARVGTLAASSLSVDSDPGRLQESPSVDLVADTVEAGSRGWIEPILDRRSAAVAPISDGSCCCRVDVDAVAMFVRLARLGWRLFTSLSEMAEAIPPEAADAAAAHVESTTGWPTRR